MRFSLCKSNKLSIFVFRRKSAENLLCGEQEEGREIREPTNGNWQICMDMTFDVRHFEHDNNNRTQHCQYLLAAREKMFVIKTQPNIYFDCAKSRADKEEKSGTHTNRPYMMRAKWRNIISYLTNSAIHTYIEIQHIVGLFRFSFANFFPRLRLRVCAACFRVKRQVLSNSHIRIERSR